MIFLVKIIDTTSIVMLTLSSQFKILDVYTCNIPTFFTKNLKSCVINYFMVSDFSLPILCLIFIYYYFELHLFLFMYFSVYNNKRTKRKHLIKYGIAFLIKYIDYSVNLIINESIKYENVEWSIKFNFYQTKKKYCIFLLKMYL